MMKKKLFIFRLLALCLSLSLYTFAPAQNPGQPPAQVKRVAVRAARMLDVRSGNVVTNARGERSHSIGGQQLGDPRRDGSV
jgi:hypothetical protein